MHLRADEIVKICSWTVSFVGDIPVFNLQVACWGHIFIFDTHNFSKLASTEIWTLKTYLIPISQFRYIEANRTCDKWLLRVDSGNYVLHYHVTCRLLIFTLLIFSDWVFKWHHNLIDVWGFDLTSGSPSNYQKSVMNSQSINLL